MGYRGYGLPVADLISEGNVGMMHAVKSLSLKKDFVLPPMRCGGLRPPFKNIFCVAGHW